MRERLAKNKSIELYLLSVFLLHIVNMHSLGTTFNTTTKYLITHPNHRVNRYGIVEQFIQIGLLPYERISPVCMHTNYSNVHLIVCATQCTERHNSLEILINFTVLPPISIYFICNLVIFFFFFLLSKFITQVKEKRTILYFVPNIQLIKL